LPQASNAFYGFLGAQTSRARCLPIAECTLALGRTLLLRAKALIEAGPGGAAVLYGDTDSVFVHCARGMG
jgi:DNA polymerase elongation subunit (family B)